MSGPVSVGEAVSSRRDELGLSQVDLALLTGLSRGTIRNIENDTVTPNAPTWEALESTLAWAPGSLQRLQENKKPILILPIRPLVVILDALVEWEKSKVNHGSSYGQFGARDFRALMGSADHRGFLPSNKRDELFDLIFTIEPDKEEIESLLDEINQSQSDNSPPRIAPNISLDKGDRVTHSSFGLGTVLETDGTGQRAAASVDFGGALGVKRLVLRYAPLEKLEIHSQDDTGDTEDDMGDHEISSLASRLGLSDDAADLLVSGQVIDYDTIEPENSENIALVALVVKKRAAPLGRRDRKYLGEVWDRLAEVLGGDDPTPESSEYLQALAKRSVSAKTDVSGATFNLRKLPDGQYRFFFFGAGGKIIGASLSYTTKEEAEQAFGRKKDKKQTEPASPVDDPWATSSSNDGGYSEDPPF